MNFIKKIWLVLLASTLMAAPVQGKFNFEPIKTAHKPAQKTSLVVKLKKTLKKLLTKKLLTIENACIGLGLGILLSRIIYKKFIETPNGNNGSGGGPGSGGPGGSNGGGGPGSGGGNNDDNDNGDDNNGDDGNGGSGGSGRKKECCSLCSATIEEYDGKLFSLHKTSSSSTEHRSCISCILEHHKAKKCPLCPEKVNFGGLAKKPTICDLCSDEKYLTIIHVPENNIPHRACQSCINAWNLQGTGTCGICRQPPINIGDYDDSDDDNDDDSDNDNQEDPAANNNYNSSSIDEYDSDDDNYNSSSTNENNNHSHRANNNNDTHYRTCLVCNCLLPLDSNYTYAYCYDCRWARLNRSSRR